MFSTRPAIVRAAALAAASIAMAPSVAACSNESEQDQVYTPYCVNADGVVQDEDLCDDDDDGSGGFWYFASHGSSSHQPGTRLNVKDPKAGKLIRPNDKNARQSVGMKPTGKVTTGKSVTVSRGGFGNTGGKSSGS